MDSLGVIAKISDGKVLYIKAKKCTELPEPVIGESYKFCGLITSPVKSFEKVMNDLIIHTENSSYQCFFDTLETIRAFAKLKGLPDLNPDFETIGLYYWGFDERASTYFRS
jgi:hypothetical protein